MRGPEHPLDPVGPVIRYYASGYGYNLEAQQYEDGVLFQGRLTEGLPMSPEGMPEEILRLVNMIMRGIFVGMHREEDRHYLTIWVNNTLLERYFDGELPEPCLPTGQIPILRVAS